MQRTYPEVLHNQHIQVCIHLTLLEAFIAAQPLHLAGKYPKYTHAFCHTPTHGCPGLKQIPLALFLRPACLYHLRRLLPKIKRVKKFPEVDCVHPALSQVAPHVKKNFPPISSCHSMQCHRKLAVQSSETFPTAGINLVSEMNLSTSLLWERKNRRGHGEEPIV